MKNKIILLISIGFLVLMICLPKNPSSQKETLFTIEKGEGSKDIASNLEQEGMIWWDNLFRAYVLVRNTSDKLQAGTYRISPSMNIFTIAEKFASGDIAKETITIPEGFTSEQIHQRLEKITASDPIVLSKHEGYLFPDTYEIPYGLDLAQVIELME